MENEISINNKMVLADDKHQIFDLIADETLSMRQLDSKYVKVKFDIKYEGDEEYRLALITNSVNSSTQINVRNMVVPLYENEELSVCIYNNSNFKGLTINKGDVIASIVIGF